jgi:hypothetical protein
MAALVRGRPRERFLAALLLALAAAAGSALAFGARAAANAERPILVPTTPPATTAATTTALTTTGSVGTTPPPETTSAATVTTPQPLPQPRPGAAAWPGGTGWTVILASIPVSAGRRGALAEARRAASSGLGRVGVLLSSDYRSLHAGYWVVFAGVYPNAAAAQAALTAARAHGYPSAYPALVEV